MAIGLITYMDTSRREDMIDIVTNVSPKDTPLLSGLPMGPGAKQTLHEYTTATFASQAHNAAIESKAYTTVDLTQPTRSSNNTQILDKAVTVSGTEAVVDGVTNAKSYQLNKNIAEHAKDMELAYMAGSRASGLSGTARQMTGIINALTTNASTRTSGSSLGETDFNNVLNAIWLNTNEVATEVYTGGTLKRDISGFTAGNTKNISADDKRLVRSIDVYESDFGMVKMFLHRDVPNGANAKMAVFINPKYHLQSWLRPTSINAQGADGDRSRNLILSEVTLEHRGEATGMTIGGYTA